MDNKENSTMYNVEKKEIRSGCLIACLKVTNDNQYISEKLEITEKRDKGLEKILRSIKVKLRPINKDELQCPVCCQYFYNKDITYEHVREKCRRKVKYDKKEQKNKMRKFLEKNFNRHSKNKKRIKIHQDADLESLAEFRYTDDIVTSKDIGIVLDDPPEYCDCEKKCDSDCQCFEKTNFLERGVWFECNVNCLCIKNNCGTKIIQNGAHVSLEIFWTNEKGHGVRALQTIPKWSFIDIYSGDLITIEKACDEMKTGNRYLWDLDYSDKTLYTMNAKRKGNISRFINHSCDPNLMILFGFTNCLDEYRPLIVFFSKRQIKKDEELTVDYRENQPFGKNYCNCNTKYCRNPAKRRKLK